MVARALMLASVALALSLAACGAARPGPPGTAKTLAGAAFQPVAEGRSTLLVFMTLWCEVCRREQPEVLTWAASNAATTRVVYVVSGSVEPKVREMARARGLLGAGLEVVVDEVGSVADRYGVEGTPTLILLGEGGAERGRWTRIAEVSAPDAALVPVKDRGEELGTTYEAELLVPAAAVARARRDLARAREQLRAHEANLSEYRADSALEQLNRRAAEAPVPVEASLEQLIAGALHVAQVTGGAFDPTWRSGDPAVDWRRVVIRDHHVSFTHPATRLGLAGVAKGWIVDALFGALVDAGYPRILVNIGGDLRVRGPRRVELADPFAEAPGRFVASLEVSDVAVATSGNALRPGHIRDPRTGELPAFEGSVTVLTRDAAMADAMATALFVMGPEAGLAFADGIDGVEAIYVTREGVRGTVEIQLSGP